MKMKLATKVELVLVGVRVRALPHGSDWVRLYCENDDRSGLVGPLYEWHQEVILPAEELCDSLLEDYQNEDPYLYSALHPGPTEYLITFHGMIFPSDLWDRRWWIAGKPAI